MTLGELAIWLHEEMDRAWSKYESNGDQGYEAMAETFDRVLDHVVPMLEGPEKASYETFLLQQEGL